MTKTNKLARHLTPPLREKDDQDDGHLAATHHQETKMTKIPQITKYINGSRIPAQYDNSRW